MPIIVIKITIDIAAEENLNSCRHKNDIHQKNVYFLYWNVNILITIKER